MSSYEEIQMQQQQQAQYEEKRTIILEQILEPAAKERLSRLSIVKKEKARSIEDSLITAATTGKLPGKVTEEQLIAMLDSAAGDTGNENKKAGIVIQRRKYGFDEEEEDDDSDLL